MFAHMFIRLIIQNLFHLLLKNFSIWNSLSDVLSAPLFVAAVSIHLCCLRRWISRREFEIAFSRMLPRNKNAHWRQTTVWRHGGHHRIYTSFQIFRIIKLAWRMFIHLWNFGKISIFLAFSCSLLWRMTIFTVFFSLFWLQILNLQASLQNKRHGLDRFHGNGPYCKILTEKEPIRAEGFA